MPLIRLEIELTYPLLLPPPIGVMGLITWRMVSKSETSKCNFFVPTLVHRSLPDFTHRDIVRDVTFNNSAAHF